MTRAVRAAYRLQFNAQFTFDEAARLAPYFASLGVSHIYASPIQTARPGSTHGYDIVDHAQINPELGGESGFAHLSGALARNGLKLLLDIVPNHMGVGGADNAWWLSVLEWGEQSPHAGVFDIDWERAGAERKLVLPFLGKPYGAALRDGELQLRYDEDEGSFSVWHWEHRFPVNPLDYRWLLEWAQVAGGGGLAMRPLYLIADELRELAEAPRPVTAEGRVARCERIKRDLAAHAKSSRAVREAIDKAVAFACGDPRTAESFAPLRRVIERQSYRPAFWRVASSEINYRRFFDINALAGVRAEDDAVFEATHALIFRLIDEGRVHGLRIDHVDGLARPAKYLASLRERLGPDFPIYVEKILEPGERLPDWPVAGTTGYEAMAELDSLFVAQSSETALSERYAAIDGARRDFATMLRETKLEIQRASFGSELATLASDVKRAADADLLTSDFTLDALRQAISEIIAALPVYRTYMENGAVQPVDRTLLTQAVDEAIAGTALETSTAHELVRALLLAPADANRSPSRQNVIERIVRRFQQLSGPVMAKSLEDTLFYRYGRWAGLNEVGGDPTRFGVDPAAFHGFNAERAHAWPDALTATATHDMKRGEDVRARLAALTHAPDVWIRLVASAERIEAEAPDARDRYMLLQTFAGAWPAGEDDDAPAEPDVALVGRFTAFAVKAVRESKRRSSWTAPDESYEAALGGWIEALLADARFRSTLRRDLPGVVRAGRRASLARLALKLTMPGAPDTYQGCEFEDLSLVDPDNRRAVDYAAREAALSAPGGGFSARKQALTATLLRERARTPALYARGDYRPLAEPRPGVICFERRFETERLVVAACIAPFADFDPQEVCETVAEGDGWSNLLGQSALEQRERGGFSFPAVVLRKSD